MSETVDQPSFAYQPPNPEDPPPIGLIGCGNITRVHLESYRNAGWEIAALCDLDVRLARERRDQYYPNAAVYEDASAVFEREDIGVVDIATHPEPRETLIAEAIRAGKHVLSQKPFVTHLDRGERLVSLAERHGVKLAVNQNGRWAPHWSWIRHAIRAGRLGKILSVHLDVHWDHDPIVLEGFDDIPDVILYDYAIHHFDLLSCLMRDREPMRVYASVARSPKQSASPPLLGQATVEYQQAQASLVFDGNVGHGPIDRTYVSGTEGTIASEGADPNEQQVALHTDSEVIRPKLDGSWFPTGFRGAMGELLVAVEAGREPINNASDNLDSLALCYAAVAAAREHEPKVPGNVRRMPASSQPARPPAE